MGTFAIGCMNYEIDRNNGKLASIIIFYLFNSENVVDKLFITRYSNTTKSL